MAETAPPDTIFHGEKRGLTIAVMASIGIIAYSNLGLTAALPDIGNDLGDVALLPWTITVELLMSGVDRDDAREQVRGRVSTILDTWREGATPLDI